MPSEGDLNPEQRQAVEHGEGPLLVVAGPGSGKTRVISERIVHLLRSVSGLRPENILALTFTDKAAEEMKQRVKKALGETPSSPFIATFHAFCKSVLGEKRRLLDKTDVWIFLRRRLSDLGLDHYRKLAEPGAFLHNLNDFFSRCQDELKTADDFEAYVRRIEKAFAERSAALDPAEKKVLEEEVDKRKELARVFRASSRLLESAGFSTLGSLIPDAVRLFDHDPDALRRFQEKYRYVLADEFQDTNFGQVELLRRMVPPPWNITAVGDDDQAIYRFRGAAHGAFQMFEAVFPGARRVYLHRNYRSGRKILSAADAVISQNERHEKKPKLEPAKDEAGAVFLVESPDYKSEAAWVASEVERLVQRGTRRGDLAVLYRAHNHRDRLVDEFRRRGIPFAIRGLSILSSALLRDLTAYLRLVDSPHDNISLTRVLLAPHWRFPEELALEARRQASKDRSSIFSALEARQGALFKDELEATRWSELVELLGDLRGAARRVPITTLFDRLTDRLGVRFLPGARDAALLESFRRFLKEWEATSETQRLREFIEYLDYFLEAGGKVETPEPEEKADAVQMMTAHAAKGLEFPVVFVLSVAPQRFPHREQKPVIEFPDELRSGPAPPPDIHLQEERRLFYVAMTRAEKRLHVSSVAKPGKKPSRFVDDLLSDPVVRACDVEPIQVSPLESHRKTVETVAERRPATPETNRRSRAPEVSSSHQSPLFDGASVPVDTVHPPLEEWAARPPALQPGEKLRLSATAIEDYRSCPLKFKLSHFFKVPSAPQAALTFGNIMHLAVRRYFELRRGSRPRFEEIAAFYLAAWKGAGFEDEYQAQAYRAAGLEQLRAFVEAQNGRELDARGIEFERHFSIDLGDVVLEGRIDQITSMDGRSTPAVELIDYKTGRPRSQKDADESLQLSIYALAARRELKLEPARLTFYFLSNNQPVSTVRTGRDLEEALAEILEVAAEIRRLAFPATPGFVCKFCDFKPLCPAHEEMF